MSKSNIVIKFMFHECIKPFWLSSFFILLTSIFWAFDINFKPYLFKLMFERLRNVPPSDALTHLLPFIIALFVTILLRNVVFRLYDFLWLRMKPAMELKINNVIMVNIMNRSSLFLQRNQAGSLNNTLRDLLENLPALVNLLFTNFTSHISSFFVSLTLCWLINIKFALLLLIWAFVFILFASIVAAKTEMLNAKAAKKQSAMFTEVLDVLNNVVRVKLFNTTKFESKRIDRYFEKFGKASKVRDYKHLLVLALQTVAYGIYQLACFFLLITEYKKGSVTIGDFILIFSINQDMIENMSVLADDVRKFGKYYGSVKRLLSESLTAYSADEKLSSKHVKPVEVESHDIEFDHVSFKYPRKTSMVLKNLSFKIKDKEKLGIVGYSGSGKSSLIKLLLRLYEPQKGTIKVSDQNIKSFDLEAFHGLFSVITQDYMLLNRTIAENIAYGKMDASQEEIEMAAKKAQAHDFIISMKKGYETLAGPKGSNLSIGQRQRIAIACAILKDAPILVMDEATAGLDLITEQKLGVALKNLMENKTVIVIAHKIEALNDLDRIIVLDKGRIVQNGAHADLYKKKGIYRTLVNIQKKNAE